MVVVVVVVVVVVRGQRSEVQSVVKGATPPYTLHTTSHFQRSRLAHLATLWLMPRA